MKSKKYFPDNTYLSNLGNFPDEDDAKLHIDILWKIRYNNHLFLFNAGVLDMEIKLFYARKYLQNKLSIICLF